MSDTQTASFPTPLVGYTDAWSYTAGAEVTGYVSGDGGTVDISLVRLDRGLDERNRPPADFARIDWTGSGSHPLAQQVHHHGSFLLVPAVRSDAADATGTFEAYSFGAWIWVASVLPGRQAVLSVAVEPEIGVGAGVGIDGTEDIAVEELVLGLNDGAPAVWLADAAGGRAAILAAADPIPTDSWHFLSLSARGGGLELRSSPRDALRGRTFSGRAPHARCVRAGGRITAAGSFGTVKRAEAELAIGAAVDLFTGKLDSPFLASRPLRDREHAELVAAGRIPESLVGDLVGLWSLAQHAGEPRAVVRSAAAGPGGRDGILVNQPMRAVTGHSWGSAGTSAAHRFADAPDDYDAVHFHRTDLGDVGWEPTFSARLPEDLPSGVYGIALRSDGGVSGPEEDLIPIYVVPGERAEQRTALIVPTFTYLAYANNVLHAGGFDMARVSDLPVVIDEADRERTGHPAYGLSLYDLHADGTGVSMSSTARPVVTERPGKRAWLTDSARHLSGDLNVVDWLHRHGIAHDIVTDFEVHTRGVELLAQYDVVLTGGHPEYCTAPMLDAVEAYRDSGGNFLYLGGNGFYWVTGVVSERPLTIEIRRGSTGIRAWSSAPGEACLSSTGEHGGMWRESGRAPQRLVGVGMSAQGWGKSSPYRIRPGIPDEHAWLLEGVEGELIGERGRVMGGAAGDEIDRADWSLGTPLEAVIVATSFGHSNFYQRNLEELQGVEHGFHGGDVDPEVHADIVYFETPGGGSVFSVGSIAWTGALLPEGGDANASRLTLNVIEHGLRKSPILP